MNIRQVEKEELPQLAKIVKQTFWDSFAHMNERHNMQDYSDRSLTFEKVKEEYENPESAFYFIIDSSDIQGYLKLNWGMAQTEDLSESALEIQRIYIIKEAHGRGLGKQLIDFSIEFAKRKGCEMVWLGVWDKNVSSIAFYEKMSFEIFGDHVFPFGDENQIDLLMKREL